MKIVITKEEVLQAVGDYAEAQGVSIDRELMVLTPLGTVELDVNSLDKQPIAGNRPPDQVTMAGTSPNIVIVDDVIPEPAPAVSTSEEDWDKSNWVNLRKPGFKDYVLNHLNTLPHTDPKTILAVQEKWENFYDEPFPGSKEAKVQAAEDGTSVGDKITVAASGDVTDKEPATLPPEEFEELPPETTPGEEETTGSVIAEHISTPENTKSLFG